MFPKLFATIEVNRFKCSRKNSVLFIDKEDSIKIALLVNKLQAINFLVFVAIVSEHKLFIINNLFMTLDCS